VDELRQLQDWYASQCDGDWEHSFGVRIETLDNPGWSVQIDLEGTDLEDVPFAEIKDMAPEREWIRCWVEGGRWNGVGGTFTLPAILAHFLTWSGRRAADGGSDRAGGGS
jgi:hypothetical protein